MADLIDIFGEDFNNILEKLDDLTPEQEILLLAIIEKASAQSEIFQLEIQQQINTMIANGMTNNTAEMAIKADLRKGGPLFKQLNNSIKAALVEGINQSSRLGQYQQYELDQQEFTWVTVSGHRICEDCVSRAGDTGTFQYHADKGLPGAGWSLCKQYCYCVLDPTGNISNNIEVPTNSGIREKGA
ncbi:MAG: hypothetical protein Unbinned4139contig1000_40 [Prokaryotic dsDNA virus sp.]|nr:MAG: hypothetical protein Unbinned4139contig1000_40 [Prokaryotic dsDNA virus sp.]|tara:strand:- start:1123 stop:1680 length:558 start_codon:yes stop_codon:yes gene_type:complete